jgi:hypothetical protein
MAQGYLFNLYKGAPLVKKGGTMIITHPCTDKFDPSTTRRTSSSCTALLPETRDAMELHKRYEQKFAQNPAYIEMYRTGHAYHPRTPSSCGTGARRPPAHRPVIVVGADNEYIPKLLGYETARRWTRRCEMARHGARVSPRSSRCTRRRS